MRQALEILGIVLVLVLGFMVGYWLRGLRPGPVPPEPQIDTLWKHDTLMIAQPVYIKERVVDTMLIPVVDTIHTRDSVFISVPREERIYEDSTYRAVVSGYRPSLDSIYIFKETAIVEIPVIKTVTKRWGIGVQGGVTYLPKTGFTPYVGLGVSYNLLNF